MKNKNIQVYRCPTHGIVQEFNEERWGIATTHPRTVKACPIAEDSSEPGGSGSLYRCSQELEGPFEVKEI